jgi:hypothetical protein
VEKSGTVFCDFRFRSVNMIVSILISLCYLVQLLQYCYTVSIADSYSFMIPVDVQAMVV